MFNLKWSNQPLDLDPLDFMINEFVGKLNSSIEFAKQWLATVGEDGAKVTGEECRFCHTQGAPEPVENEIKEKGFFIQKMEGCP